MASSGLAKQLPARWAVASTGELAEGFIPIRTKLDLLAVNWMDQLLRAFLKNGFGEISHDRAPLFESREGKPQRRVKSWQRARNRLPSTLEPAFLQKF